jgi:hypothetical protein
MILKARLNRRIPRGDRKSAPNAGRMNPEPSRIHRSSSCWAEERGRFRSSLSSGVRGIADVAASTLLLSPSLFCSPGRGELDDAARGEDGAMMQMPAQKQKRKQKEELV